VRIAVVHNLPPGGAHRRLASQLEHLGEDVFEVCLETATPITGDASVISFSPLAPRRPRWMRPPLRYRDLASLRGAWRRAAEPVQRSGAEVVYANPCRYLQAPSVLLAEIPPALYFCDEPRRVDAELDTGATRNRLTRRVYGRLYASQRRLDRAAMARAARVATNSRYTASEIERVYGRAATVVTMGVADSLLSGTAPPAREPFVLSVGALVPAKGHDLVIQAAASARLRPAVAIVAPREDAAESRRLRALAAEMGVALTLEVGISDARLGSLYRSALATLYLARREPLGLVSLEAQACGCPVIVADEGGLPETILDEVTGWRAPRDPRIVGALVDRLSDDSLRLTMARAAREHATSVSWRVSAEQVTALLSELRHDHATRASLSL
jgi:glycosyltransferase involved in cell wall biosynthesis